MAAVYLGEGASTNGSSLMAFLGRVPEAENVDGNLGQLSAIPRRTRSHAVRGNGQAVALHRSSLREAGAGAATAAGGGAGTAATGTLTAAQRLTRAVFFFGVAAGVLAAAACAPSLGDFGRPRPSVVHDEVLPALGRQAARSRGEPVSGFRYTDTERELRDRSWSLLMPQLKRQLFDRWVAEMRRTRIISVEKTVPDRQSYVRTLLNEDFRSSSARFARLEMDIRNDRIRYPDFVAVANNVAEYDRVRERSLARTADLTPEELADAVGRIEENRLLVWTVQKSMRERAGTYRYALERLVIEAPDNAAIGAESELLALETELGVLAPSPAGYAIYGK